MTNFAFCHQALTILAPYEPKIEQLYVCEMLLDEAESFGLDKSLVLATSWRETRLFMKNQPNTSGCAGPLQIKVKYWCPNSDGLWNISRQDGSLQSCDLITQGLFALKYYIKKDLTLKEKLCHFGPAYKCKCIFGTYKTSRLKRYNCSKLSNKKIKNAKQYVNKIIKDFNKITRMNND